MKGLLEFVTFAGKERLNFIFLNPGCTNTGYLNGILLAEAL